MTSMKSFIGWVVVISCAGCGAEMESPQPQDEASHAAAPQGFPDPDGTRSESTSSPTANPVAHAALGESTEQVAPLGEIFFAAPSAGYAAGSTRFDLNDIVDLSVYTRVRGISTEQEMILRVYKPGGALFEERSVMLSTEPALAPASLGGWTTFAVGGQTSLATDSIGPWKVQALRPGTSTPTMENTFTLVQ
jgi:hypothetical protein